MSSRNTIILKSKDLGEWYDEGRAGGTVKPGMQIEQRADGLWYAGPAAGVLGQTWVAIEDDFQGQTATSSAARTVNDPYVATELIRMYNPKPGDVMQMILKAGQTVTTNDFATPNGDGTLKKWTNEASKQWKFMEAMDLTVGGSVDSFIKVMRV